VISHSARADKSSLSAPREHYARLCDRLEPLSSSNPTSLQLYLPDFHTLNAIQQSSRLQDGFGTQVCWAEVQCVECTDPPYTRALPGLCLSLLPEDVQHCLYFYHPIDQTKVCFQSSDTIPTTDPTLASFLYLSA
jgi:hypothetical protein